MRKVIACEWTSLDGVVQAPVYRDEDPSDGFRHGGWHTRYFDAASMRWVVENVTQAGGPLAERVGGGAAARPASQLPSQARGVTDAEGAPHLAELDIAPG
jgi:hypothetical protein